MRCMGHHTNQDHRAIGPQGGGNVMRDIMAQDAGSGRALSQCRESSIWIAYCRDDLTERASAPRLCEEKAAFERVYRLADDDRTEARLQDPKAVDRKGGW